MAKIHFDIACVIHENMILVNWLAKKKKLTSFNHKSYIRHASLQVTKSDKSNRPYDAG